MVNRVLLILIYFALLSCAHPVSGKPVKRVVVVVVPAATLEDMAYTMPTVRRLMEQGAVAVMNARTAAAAEREARWLGIRFDIIPERPTLESAYLTLGAGARSLGNIIAGEAADAGEMTKVGPARKVFQRRTGILPDNVELLHLSVPFIMNDSKRLSYSITPGLLGETLRKAGLKTACFGNSDTGQEIHREAVALAMDAVGRVDYGSIGIELMEKDRNTPGGFRTDHNRLLAEYRRKASKASLVVVETGDTGRVDRYTPLMNDFQAQNQLTTAFRRTDMLVANLLQEIDLDKELLMVVSPIPSRIAWRTGNRLAPVVMVGPGIKQGLLYSPSTRRSGLMVNTDLAPTIMNVLGVEVPKTAIGRPVEPVSDESALSRVLQYNRRQTLQFGKQGVIPRTYIWVQVILLALAWLLAWFFPGFIANRICQVILLVPAALPAAMLFTGGLPWIGATSAIALVAVGALLLSGGLLYLARRPVTAVILMAVIYMAGLLSALFLSKDWITSSVYGYSASEGARYYGLGNEYMGYLVGASILIAALLVMRARAHRLAGLGASAVVLGIGTAAIGFPSMGANSGGGISAAAGSAAAVLFLSGARMNRKTLLLIAGAGLAFVGGLVALDLMRGSGSQSHIGYAAASVASGGWMEAFDVISRKLEMNYKLLKFSPSSRLLAVSIGFLAWSLYRLHGLFKEHPALFAGVEAILVGAVAAFVFNDSGVLAAANCLMYAVMLLLAIEMEQHATTTHKQA